MKKILLTGIIILLCLSTASSQQKNYIQPKVTLQVFYDELSDYGIWLHDKQLGYVWLPNEDGSFRPYYTNGYWAVTEYGHTWVSFYRWGWATFHYGRWTYNSYYGWLWVPGYEWGPAWVSWRHNSELYGWAPLSPHTEVGPDLQYVCPEDWWTFVNKHDIYNARTTLKYNASKNSEILEKTYSLNSIYQNEFTKVMYATGPTSDEVCKITDGVICEETGQKIFVHKMQYLFKPSATTVRDCIIYIYRPDVIEPNSNIKDKPAPIEYMNAPQPIQAPEPVGEPGRRAPFKDYQEMQEDMLIKR